MREGHGGEEAANQYHCNYPPHLLDTQPVCWGLFPSARGTQKLTTDPNLHLGPKQNKHGLEL